MTITLSGIDWRVFAKLQEFVMLPENIRTNDAERPSDFADFRLREITCIHRSSELHLNGITLRYNVVVEVVEDKGLRNRLDKLFDTLGISPQ